MIDPLDHIRELAQGIGPRPSTGEGERRAAAYVSQQLQNFGYLVKDEPFRSPNSFSQVYIPIYVLALIGFVADALGSPAFALLLTGVAFVCFVGENTTALKLVSAVIPKAKSHNVVGRLASRELPRRRLVLVAHLDSTRSGLMWHPRLVRSFRATFLVLTACLFAGPARDLLQARRGRQRQCQRGGGDADHGRGDVPGTPPPAARRPARWGCRPSCASTGRSWPAPGSSTSTTLARVRSTTPPGRGCSSRTEPARS